MEPSIRIIPSNDSAFRRHVERLAARHSFRTADELAARLRTLFPRVVVRPSEVAGHQGVWYVYRDGVWHSSDDLRWWAHERTPRVSVTLDGWVDDANAPARAILGLAPSDSLPRYFTDFVVPGTLQDATDLFSLIAAGHEFSATMLIRPTSGEVIACDLRAWAEDDRVHAALRLAEDIPAQTVAARMVAIRLICQPTTDILFERYATEVLARMPEPTPDGLTLRLRRLYPHARVEPDDGTWTVFRDAAGAGDPADRWWASEGLPAVRYDRQGRIFEANPAALAILGHGLVGQHWQELVTAGTTEQVATVLRLIAEVGWAQSRFRMPGPDGYLFEFDSYTEVAGDGFLTVMRPRASTDGPSAS